MFDFHWERNSGAIHRNGKHFLTSSTYTLLNRSQYIWSLTEGNTNLAFAITNDHQHGKTNFVSAFGLLGDAAYLHDFLVEFARLVALCIVVHSVFLRVQFLVHGWC